MRSVKRRREREREKERLRLADPVKRERKKREYSDHLLYDRRE